MNQHVVLVLTRHGGGWRTHCRDFPNVQTEGPSAEHIYFEAAQAIRREIHKARLAGQSLPRLHSYAEVRIDDVWLRECDIRWSSAIVRLVNLPPRLEAVFSAGPLALIENESKADVAPPASPILPSAKAG